MWASCPSTPRVRRCSSTWSTPATSAASRPGHHQPRPAGLGRGLRRRRGGRGHFGPAHAPSGGAQHPGPVAAHARACRPGRGGPTVSLVFVLASVLVVLAVLVGAMVSVVPVDMEGSSPVGWSHERGDRQHQGMGCWTRPPAGTFRSTPLPKTRSCKTPPTAGFKARVPDLHRSTGLARPDRRTPPRSVIATTHDRRPRDSLIAHRSIFALLLAVLLRRAPHFVVQ